MSSDTVCQYTFKRGSNEGNICGKVAYYGDYCAQHKYCGDETMPETNPVTVTTDVDIERMDMSFSGTASLCLRLLEHYYSELQTKVKVNPTAQMRFDLRVSIK